MPARRIKAPQIDFDALVRSLAEHEEIPPEFTPTELARAESAATAPLPAYPDRTDINLVTVDPAGSRDLDQAVALERIATGYRVYYAIADVAHYVHPGDELDVVTNERGQTFYFPDRRLGLHPAILAEGGASLLPGQTRPAALWTIDLDRGGNATAIRVERALVRSRVQYDYTQVQRAIVAGNAPEPLEPLAELGALRIARARARGAIDLSRPEQRVVKDGSSWRLEFRAQLPVEEFNSHISLLTGEAAAQLMLAGRIGLLRTLPPADDFTIKRVRRGAKALGFGWPSGATAAQVLATVDVNDPKGGAFMDLAASLLRGSGYTAFAGDAPAESGHAGVGAPYAHVTAPLRRLADRYATEVCLALCAGAEVPDWTTAALPGLPDAMTTSGRRANTVERAVLDYTEAVMLADRVGGEFPAVVIEVDPRRDADRETTELEKLATIVVADPAVRARCIGPDLKPGDQIIAKLTEADPQTRQVRFVAG